MSFIRKLFGIKEPEFNVVDEEDRKELRYGFVTYSRTPKNGKVYTGSYWDFFAPLPALYRSPKVLMIGLGGGTIFFQYRKLYGDIPSLSAVEIDQKVIDLYKKSMSGSSIDAEIILGDGSTYIETHKGYDIIILDAYISDYIPKPFFDEKFIDRVHEALNEEGVFAINYAMSIRDMLSFNSYIGKLEKRFYVYRVSAGSMSGNTILICSKKLRKDEIISRVKKDFSTKFGGEHVLRAYEGMF
ncbi:MAG: hypothetical protein OH316_01755 [Candidatus Parvarchaeota archaeon]|nr:hypothetical protein [Candidatus Parvarchaeota archaeon]